MRLTKKQRIVLEVICEGLKNDQGVRIGWLDTLQICERVPYRVSIHSMKFTIRFLMEKGLVQKGDEELRRERWVVPIIPTNEAFDWIVSHVSPRIVEHDDGVVEAFL